MNLESRWQSIRDDAVLYIEREARRCLMQDDTLNEFIMANGTAFFTVVGGDTRHVEEVSHYLDVFINRWHDRVKVMGEPMRFTKYGRKITQW